MSDRITPGVFFTPPTALPRGRHELNREQVMLAQRERMMIATTELLAAEGYRGVGVREICSRAAVSRSVFYECFDDKDACMFAAYERFIAVLVERLAGTEAAGGDWRAYIAGCVDAYLDMLQRDLVVARAFLVEMDALGRAARRRRRDALAGIATVIRARRQELAPAGEARVPLSAYVGLVYLVRQTCLDILDESDEPDLLGLQPGLAPWVSRLIEEPAEV